MVIFSWDDIQNNKFISYFGFQKSVITIGVFDGIHTGHKMLLNTVLQDKNKKLTGIVTFNDRIFSLKKTSEKPIFPIEKRLSLFNRMGFDFVILLDFTEDIAGIDGIDFLNNLFEKCGLSKIVEGTDFNLGKGGKTGKDEIVAFCQSRNIDSQFIPAVLYKGKRISSTYIRGLLEKNKNQEAGKLISET